MEKSKTNSQETCNDSTIILKFSSRILTYLRELEAKIEFQEEILLELRKSQLLQDSPKKLEPIRGIHGLAEFLGVSPVTAQKLKNSGKIPFAQFERIVLFDPQKVMDALETNKKVK
jgi:hypothetical protein